MGSKVYGVVEDELDWLAWRKMPPEFAALRKAEQFGNQPRGGLDWLGLAWHDFVPGVLLSDITTALFLLHPRRNCAL